FGGSGDQPRVSLIGSGGGETQGTIMGSPTNTQIVATFPALEPGQYKVSVTFCARTGIANALLNVTENPPKIKSFSAEPNQIGLCAVFIRLIWSVDSARGIRIKRNGIVIPGSERTRSQNCGLWEESFDDPQIQSNPVQYTLEAFPSSGSPVA